MSAHNVLISIITAGYNSSGTISKVIESILNQNYINIEYVLIDDASRDDTYAIMKNYAQRHKNIKILRNDSNLGESESINRAWEMSLGEFVGIVNSDDPQEENWLSSMCQFINENPDYVAYYPNLHIVNNKSQVIQKVELKKWTVSQVVGKLQTTSSAGILINKKKLPSYFRPRNNKVKYPSDLFQSLELVKHGKIAKVPNVYANWFLNENSSSQNYDLQNIIKIFIAEIDNYFESTKVNSILRQKQRAYVNLYGQIWRLLLRRESFYFAIRNFPWKKFVDSSFNLMFILWALFDYGQWCAQRIIKHKFSFLRN